MDFYLIDPAGPEFHFPVNPAKVTIRREKLTDVVNIINLGQVEFPHGEKVKEITFSSFFPKEYDSSYCRYPDIHDPQEAMNKLTAWMMSKKPVRLMITETIVNVLVLVSAHTTTFRGGEPGDVYFDLTCHAWQELKVRTAAEISVALQGAEPRPDTRPVPAVYEVRTGDSLWAIAKMQYGDGNRWREIYQTNEGIIGPDADLILPGQKLVMPQ
ncbi:LysM peptidoglycan-binding domain-containing protein [Pelotomaculum propionicicum]|uniref:LysM peptidoglycan-binding domain-containing protein n=1 Tax=Pelotomaculum propionicicum TaxID=258475 RepID=UPI003B7BB310